LSESATLEQARISEVACAIGDVLGRVGRVQENAAIPAAI